MNSSMASSISIFSNSTAVLLAWAALLSTISYVANMENTIALGAVPSESALKQEADALLQSGWWTGLNTTNTSITISPCSLLGVTCNHFGSITNISLLHDSQMEKKLGRFLNGSSFPNLVYLDLAEAGLVGNIPPEIGTLSKLTHLDLSNNILTGQLPILLGNLSQLEMLDMFNNYISGSIPPQLGNLNNLISLNLSSNNLSGPIPSSLGQLIKLTHLRVPYNHISGQLPASLVRLTQLVEFDAFGNGITGSIPVNIGNLKNLETLSLSQNYLNGSLPSTLSQLSKLTYLSLSSNQISGPIPEEIGELSNLTDIYLDSNMLNGSLPSTLGQLSKLTSLRLSSNKLSGPIPEELSNLYSLDLSYNNLSGIIPSSLVQRFDYYSFVGNQDLCSNFTGFHPCFFSRPVQKIKVSHSMIRIIVPASVILVIFVLMAILFYTRRLKNKRVQSTSAETTKKKGDICSIWNFDGKVAYEDIIQATEDFDIRYCIGTGGYGSVYRARLPNGKVVALKKLHGSEAEEPNLRKSFTNEVETL